MTQNVLSAIGQTPMIHLSSIWQGPGELHAKAEFLNPGGSMKDRAALGALRRAERTGRLKPGQPVIEMTSGNMGAGLAVVCAVTGHPLTLVMSEGNSPERRRMIAGLGAKLELVPQVDGAPGEVTGPDIDAAKARAVKLAEKNGWYYVDQWNNPGCVEGHETTTGPEIWEDMGGRLDAFVMIVGSCATFVGAGRALKERDADVKLYAVEPAGAAVLAGRDVTKARHKLQGTGYAFTPPMWDESLPDGFLTVTDDEAGAMRTRLGAEEGLYVGYSAAANVAACVKLLQSGELGDAPRIATVLCDTGLKY